MYLSEAQVAAFHQQGYLFLREVLCTIELLGEDCLPEPARERLAPA